MNKIILHGNCLDEMRKMEDGSISCIVTDPPYGLKFMGKDWDHGIPGIEFWKEALRVSKPGTWLLAFGGTRTHHRLTCAIEDAGWEIRDCIMWLYGSGFCKSHNFGCICKGDAVQYNHEKETKDNSNLSDMCEKISKTRVPFQEIEESLLQLQLQREGKIEEFNQIFGKRERQEMSFEGNENGEESCLEGRSNLQEEQGKLHRAEICEMSNRIHSDVQEGRVCDGAPSSDGKTLGSGFTENRSSSSQRSQYEKQRDREFGIISGQSDAQNRRMETCEKCGRLKNFKGWGTALKPAYEPIIVAMKPCDGTFANNAIKHGIAGINIDECRIGTDEKWIRNCRGQNRVVNILHGRKGVYQKSNDLGRWPANVIFDEEAGKMLDEQSGITQSKSGGKTFRNSSTKQLKGLGETNRTGHDDSGGASRFFYCAKSSTRERNAGLEGMPEKQLAGSNKWTDVDYRKGDGEVTAKPKQNFHPTVKPLALMEYLIKLVMPKLSPSVPVILLDPFAGSGTTILAAKNLGIEAIGIELNEEYCEIARNRIK